MGENFKDKLSVENIGGLRSITETSDGKAVRKMLEGDGAKLMDAYRNGDTDALSEAFQKVISTDEGARLIGSLSKLLGEKSERN